MRLRLLARLLVLLGSLSLAVPSARAASFGSGEHRTHIDDVIFGLPGSSCSGTYAGTVHRRLPVVETSMGTVAYKLEGVPASLTFNPTTRVLSGTLAANLKQASTVSHSLKYTATDSAGSDSLTFEIAIVDERPALEAFYTSTNGAKWTNKTNWAADIAAATCLKDLYGVTLTFGAVSTLNLSGNNLTGEIPEELEDLHNLSTLNLSNNSLTGSIPEEVEHLHRLWTLNLSNNKLTGSIPEDAGHLHSLRTLNLSNNKLTGSIPGEVGHLHELITLDLSNNSLTGSIPQDFDSQGDYPHPGHLENIDLSNNSLTGSIPKLASDTPRLKRLDLSHNQLSGKIPTDLHDVLLEEFDLSHNRLSGTIPADFSSYLLTIDFSHNQLSGAIPTAFPDELLPGALVKTIDFSHNGLTGPIPPKLTKLWRLEYLDLSHNGLTGAIPDPGSSLFGLKTLDLSHNQLSGTIHANFNFVSNLKTLDLSHNQLSGAIPFLDLVLNLETLDLSHNELSGKIPPARDGYPSIPASVKTLHLHNNTLSGEIPATLGNSAALRSLSLYHNPPPGSTSSASLFKYPSGMKLQSNMNLLVPNTGYTMCLYDDAAGATGSTQCTIPTTVDQLRVFTVDQSRAWDCTTWIAVRWKPPSPAPRGYEVQYRLSAPDAAWTAVTVGTETFAAISGLTRGRSYEVRVRTTTSPDANKPALRTPWLQTSITLSSE